VVGVTDSRIQLGEMLFFGLQPVGDGLGGSYNRLTLRFFIYHTL